MKVDLDNLTKFLVTVRQSPNYSMGSLGEFFSADQGLSYRVIKIGRFSEVQEVKNANTNQAAWALYYHGQMNTVFASHVQADIVSNNINEALLQFSHELPLRGPKIYQKGNGSFIYVNDVRGNISKFTGHERLFFEGSKVYHGDFIGGIIT